MLVKRKCLGRSTVSKYSGFRNYEVGHPALSTDDKYLYFSGEAPTGYGGMDIYRSTIKANNAGHPINLGPIVNSLGDEVFPTVRADGTLYFASDGHKGMGGMIFIKLLKMTKEILLI